MFSKILVKLVDHAIVPALLLIAARVVSVALLSKRFDIPLSFDSFEIVLPRVSDRLLINSYSILSMVAVLSVGLSYILLKSYFFHDSHISPPATAKVFSLGLSSFIQASFDLYSQGAVWLSYMYLLSIVSGALSFFGHVYSWVFLTSLIISLVATYLLVLDVEREVEMSRSKQRTGDVSDEFTLTLGDIDDD